MKILQISPTYYASNSVVGGGEKYLIYMSKALLAGAKQCDLKITIDLLSFGVRAEKYTINEQIIGEVMSGEPWNPHSIELPKLDAKINDFDVIIVHQCLSAFGLFVGSHARLAGKIVVGMDHGGGEHSIVLRSPESSEVYDLFLAQSLFASHSFRDFIVRTKVIPGPVDTDYYNPDRSIKRDPHLVVAVGRILPHKAFDRIIQSIQKPLRLVIAGTKSDPSYFDYLVELTRRSPYEIEIIEGLSDDQIRHLFRQAALFVHASTHFDYRGTYYHKPELLGLAPLEALSCGTPTLVSNAGSLSELTSIDGCLSFSDDNELSKILQMYADKSIEIPKPHDIHNRVVDRYGMKRFGKELIDELFLVGNN
jgi:glycosyltransferase involved in cell wall biosynthesis